MKAWMLVGLAAPVLAVAPFALPIWAQSKAATEAVTKEIVKEKPPDETATIKEEEELVNERRKRTIINDVMRCPKRPTDQQFRTYNLLNDQIIKLLQSIAHPLYNIFQQDIEKVEFHPQRLRN